MENGIKLSVMVPVYNVEPYIRRSLDSIINQTYRNLEIILIDDGSTDGSGEICDEYALLDSRIKVVHKENGGLVSARKEAVMRATGEYAISVDSDDWIEAEAYEKIIEKLEKYHPDMLAFGYKKEYVDFEESYPLEYKEGYYSAEEFWDIFNKSVDYNLFFKQPIDMTQWNKAIKTDIIRRHQLNCSEKLSKGEDDAVIFPVLLDINDIYIESACWYHYCVRNTSILWKDDIEDYNRYIQLAKHLLFSIEKSNRKDRIKKEFVIYKLLHHLILDIPEKMFTKKKCLIYPKIRPSDNIIIYGKGVLANRMIARINEINYCNIVGNIDSKDVDIIKHVAENSYQYIVVAVFNSKIVKEILKKLESYNIGKDKIVIMDKENMTKDLLPKEIRELYERVLDNNRYLY